ncbi:hypothetical protein NL676_014673 [Syzygium grande]|nr:hypothetical protein NL676_014673 [Syzygium grande]
MVLGNFTTVIEEVYALGGRKFAFQNVGPIGCMLATRASSGINGCPHDPSILAKMHNIALSRFKEGTSACCGSGAYNGNFTCGGKNGTATHNLCGDPSEYVWFDPAHPTESANRQLASLLWNGPTRIVRPYNLKIFFDASNVQMGCRAYEILYLWLPASRVEKAETREWGKRPPAARIIAGGGSDLMRGRVVWGPPGGKLLDASRPHVSRGRRRGGTPRRPCSATSSPRVPANLMRAVITALIGAEASPCPTRLEPLRLIFFRHWREKSDFARKLAWIQSID